MATPESVARGRLVSDDTNDDGAPQEKDALDVCKPRGGLAGNMECVGIGRGKSGKALALGYASKQRSMYTDDASDGSDDDAEEPRFGKMPKKYNPRDATESDDDEARLSDDDEARRSDDEADARDDDDCTSNGSASMASKRVFRRKASKLAGVCQARMRKMGKRAGVKMCRKEVHDIMTSVAESFVAGITNDACAIRSGVGKKAGETLMIGEVQYALQRRNRSVMK